MELGFDLRRADVGTPSFNLARTLMEARSGGADLGECLSVASRVGALRPGAWVSEWAAMAERTLGLAQAARERGSEVSARDAYFRASNYFRAAMMPLSHTDDRLDRYLTSSRLAFQDGARLHGTEIETIAVPFEDARLPGYFVSGGGSARPTLLSLNGGDSTNEELVHWLGFAAVERGWNFCTFEGPGQWSALQLNPGLHLRPDYELPTAAVIDHLVGREEVDPSRIALFGPSLGAGLAARVAAFEPRISACICDGFVADVYEAWHAVWPRFLQQARPAVFDLLFGAAEKVDPQLRALANHFRWMLGVARPHEMIEAWRPYNVSGLAPKIHVPVLFMYGEAELAQTDDVVMTSAMRFVEGLGCPTAMRVFGADQGWASSHCQVGAAAALQETVFGWLAEAPGEPGEVAVSAQELAVAYRHLHGTEAKAALDRIASRRRAIR